MFQIFTEYKLNINKFQLLAPTVIKSFSYCLGSDALKTDGQVKKEKKKKKHHTHLTHLVTHTLFHMFCQVETHIIFLLFVRIPLGGLSFLIVENTYIFNLNYIKY